MKSGEANAWEAEAQKRLAYTCSSGREVRRGALVYILKADTSVSEVQIKVGTSREQPRCMQTAYAKPLAGFVTSSPSNLCHPML